MHVCAGPELKVTLCGITQYAAVRNSGSGAPFRAVTARHTIGVLPGCDHYFYTFFVLLWLLLLSMHYFYFNCGLRTDENKVVMVLIAYISRDKFTRRLRLVKVSQRVVHSIVQVHVVRCNPKPIPKQPQFLCSGSNFKK